MDTVEVFHMEHLFCSSVEPVMIKYFVVFHGASVSHESGEEHVHHGPTAEHGGHRDPDRKGIFTRETPQSLT